MSACRIARRVASKVRCNNPCTEAVDAETLVRKVFHYLCHPFSSWRGGRRAVGDVERRVVVWLGSYGWSQTGVRRSVCGGAHRLVWQAARATTPLVLSPLATKGKKNGGAA